MIKELTEKPDDTRFKNEICLRFFKNLPSGIRFEIAVS
jgi:hypothetical protein